MAYRMANGKLPALVSPIQLLLAASVTAVASFRRSYCKQLLQMAYTVVCLLGMLVSDALLLTCCLELMLAAVCQS